MLHTVELCNLHRSHNISRRVKPTRLGCAKYQARVGETSNLEKPVESVYLEDEEGHGWVIAT